MNEFIGKGFLSGFQVKKLKNNLVLDEILNFDIEKHYNPGKYVVALFCEESSSRTRFSTESLLHKLGANVIFVKSLAETSYAKGETLQESLKVWSNYFDLIAIRTPTEYLPFIFNQYSSIPIINLGDGSNEHPSQGLATLVHAYKQFGRISGLDICLWGDFPKSRTAHSVAIMFSLLGANVYIFSIPESPIPIELIKNIKIITNKNNIHFINDLDRYSEKFDIFYINRLQKERWTKIPQYSIFHTGLCQKLRPKGIILHPLPHTEEINDEIMNHPQSKIIEHIKITKQTRAWLLFKYKYAYENKIALIDNTEFLNRFYHHGN